MVHKQAWSIKNYRYVWDVSTWSNFSQSSPIAERRFYLTGIDVLFGVPMVLLIMKSTWVKAVCWYYEKSLLKLRHGLRLWEIHTSFMFLVPSSPWSRIVPMWWTRQGRCDVTWYTQSDGSDTSLFIFVLSRNCFKLPFKFVSANHL
jgi:hypothetical protein